MRFGVALVAALVLSACGSAEEPSEPVTVAETAAPIQVEPDGGIGDGAKPLNEVAGTIPGQFRGVWDYIEGTCAPESDLRMEISDKEIRFYESYGRVTGIRLDGDDAIVDLAMEGEGETWENRIRLTFDKSGEHLLALDAQQTEPTKRDMPRKRCTEQE